MFHNGFSTCQLSSCNHSEVLSDSLFLSVSVNIAVTQSGVLFGTNCTLQSLLLSVSSSRPVWCFRTNRCSWSWRNVWLICTEISSNVNLTVTIVLCVVCQQLYDRISSKVVSPTRAPPSDAVQKCREVAELLRELDQNSPELESEIVELEELRDILARPHVRVSKRGFCWRLSVCRSSSPRSWNHAQCEMWSDEVR